MRLIPELPVRSTWTAPGLPGLPYPYTQAGLAERAAGFWLRAGERAGRASANVEAIGHLTKGLEVLRALPDTPERARLELPMLIALGGPLIATKGYAALELADAYTRAQRLCERLGESVQLFTVLRGCAIFTTWARGWRPRGASTRSCWNSPTGPGSQPFGSRRTTQPGAICSASATPTSPGGTSSAASR